MDEKSYWQRRLSRRRTLGTAAIGGAGLAGLALIGCRQDSGTSGSTTSTTSGTTEKQAKRGGTLRHANGQETVGDPLDPMTSTPLKGEGLRLVHQGLLNYHPVTFDVVPELAQKWEQPSQTDYVFTMQPGVKWQNKAPANGRAFTVQDMVYSLERARTPDPNFTGRSLLETVDKITAVDANTLRITAKGPDAPLLSKLSGDPLLAMNPEVVEKAGKFLTADVIVGTGAFMMTSVQEKVGAEFVRNPDYWKPGLPYLDGFRTTEFGSPGDQRAWASFLGSQLDAVVVPGEESKKYIAQLPAGTQPLWYADTTCWPATPNTKVKPFDDARVTRAFRLLLDHEEFKSAWAETFFGSGRHGSFLPVSLAGWDFTEEEYKSRFLEWKSPKDDAIKEALSLLSAAGFTKSNPLVFELAVSAGTNYGKADGEIMHAQFRQNSQGVADPQFKGYDTATYQQVRAQRTYQYGAFSNGASFNEVDSNFSQLFHSKGSRNYWNFGDDKLDGMIDRQRTIFDIAQRKSFVKEILLYMIDIFPGSIVSNRQFLNATKPQVQNFNPEFWLHGSQYEQVWLDA